MIKNKPEIKINKSSIPFEHYKGYFKKHYTFFDTVACTILLLSLVALSFYIDLLFTK